MATTQPSPAKPAAAALGAAPSRGSAAGVPGLIADADRDVLRRELPFVEDRTWRRAVRAALAADDRAWGEAHRRKAMRTRLVQGSVATVTLGVTAGALALAGSSLASAVLLGLVAVSCEGAALGAVRTIRDEPRSDCLALAGALARLPGERGREFAAELEARRAQADPVEAVGRMVRASPTGRERPGPGVRSRELTWAERLALAAAIVERGTPVLPALLRRAAAMGTGNPGRAEVRRIVWNIERIEWARLGVGRGRRACLDCLQPATVKTLVEPKLLRGHGGSEPIRVNVTVCPGCGRSDRLATAPGGIVAIVGEGPDPALAPGPVEGELRIDPRAAGRDLPIDRVRVGPASEVEVEGFALAVLNDPDPARSQRLRRATVEIRPDAALSDNARAVLERTFASVGEAGGPAGPAAPGTGRGPRPR